MRTRALLSFAGVLLLRSIPAAADVLRVNDDAPPGGDGSSWASAFDDLQLALGAASPGDEVWVAAGRYRPSPSDPSVSFFLPDGVSVYGGFAGTETVRDEREPAAHVVVLDGDLLGDDLPGFGNYADNALHVVIAAGVARAHLDGVTVRGGRLGGGAGLSIQAAEVALANLVVTENRTFGGGNEGGGAWIRGGSASVRACAFVGNHATGGGGLVLRDVAQAFVADCTFERNHATGGAGLDVEGTLVGTVKVVACAFRENSATGGAGILVSPETFGVVSVERCTFERNDATTGAGLNVTVAFPGSVSVADCVFRENTATAGGGIALAGELLVPARVEGCRFEENRACAGGGLFLLDAAVEVVACEFRANHLPDFCGVGTGGGAIRVGSVSSSVAIERSLLSDSDHALLMGERGSRLTAVLTTFANANVDAPAILLTHTTSLALESCIVWGAAPEQIETTVNAVVTAQHSDVRAGLPGPGNLDVDPGFVDAAGGDLRLAPGSPCIDAGNPELVRVGSDLGRDSRLLDGDLDGRVVVDMGADEHGPLHLEVHGIPAPGETLTFVTTGPSGLQAYLLFSAPGRLHLPNAGTLFLDLASPALVVVPWSAPPSSVPLTVPPAVLGRLYHVQELGLAPAARVVSNYVPLAF